MSAANQLPITNVVNISVSQASPGIGAYNTSNLALFTDEAPNLNTFGSLGYAVYLTPTQVGIDFGTSSRTYLMANAVFSQQPNILNNSGQLIVILMTNSVQTLSFSGTPASGTFTLSYQTHLTAAINWNDTAAMIQTKLRAVTGLSQLVVTGSMATTVVIQMAGIYSPASLIQGSNSLMTSAPVAITITITPTAPETLAQAITRTANLVQYFGIVVDVNADIIGQSDVLAAAAVVQALNKMLLVVATLEADVQPGGMIDLLRTGSLSQTRGLYYSDTTNHEDLLMCAAYAGKGFSTNFNGSNTTSTMHLKILSTIQPDPTITQTILSECQASGADAYVSLQGVPAVFCSGANGGFFDEIYNLQWLVGALQVAGFNYLAQTGTKVSQTEAGMDGLKSAYRAVMETAVNNQYVAPGSWTSAVTFGNQVLLVQNIAQRGYYIYSTPVAQQLQSARVARQAPLVQIALKEAGAIQSSNVIVTVNP